VSSNFGQSNVVYNSLNALSNFSISNNAWTLNNLAAFSNFSTLNNVWTSNNLVALSNFNTSNYVWSSNIFGKFSPSNAVYLFVNSNTVRSTFASNIGIFTSNNLSNYRLTATAIDYGTLTNKPSFDSTNNALSVGSAVLGSAGLAFGAYNLFNGLEYVNGIFQSVANATTDFINLASGYQKLTNYIEMGVFTTRYANGCIIMKSNTTFNLVLTPWNLTTSCNGYFVLNSMTTSNSSVSITSNLSVGRTLSNTGNASITGTLTAGATTILGGLSLTNNMTTISGVSSLLYTPSLNLNSYHLLNVGVNTVSNENTSWHAFSYYSNASPSNYGALGMWGQPFGTASFNAMGNGRFGVCTTTPVATLDINGTGNVSETLTVGALTGNFSNNTVFGGLVGIENASPTHAVDIFEQANSPLQIQSL
jgi:hypothetical protein